MEYIRKQCRTLKERMEESRKFMQVIEPRQVGKSIFMRQAIRKVSIPYTMEVANEIAPQNTD